MRNSRWVRLLAYVTGSVNQELLLRNEYLAAENRILRAKLPPRLRLSNPERAGLAEIGKRLGRKVLAEIACVAKPDTILAWYRKLAAQKFDGSKHRQYRGRPSISAELETLVVQIAKENSGWGYDRIVGALTNLGHRLSDQTVKNVLRRHGIAPAPKRSQVTSWKDFLAAHMSVLAGCDFFTVEVLSWRGLVTYYVLFFLHLESRRVHIAPVTKHPDQEWMEANRAQRDTGNVGLSSSVPLCSARSRHEVLFIVSIGTGKRRSQDHSTASPKSESERVRGTLGALG
jgi:Homeodomain-like domain